MHPAASLLISLLDRLLVEMMTFGVGVTSIGKVTYAESYASFELCALVAQVLVPDRVNVIYFSSPVKQIDDVCGVRIVVWFSYLVKENEFHSDCDQIAGGVGGNCLDGRRLRFVSYDVGGVGPSLYFCRGGLMSDDDDASGVLDPAPVPFLFQQLSKACAV